MSRITSFTPGELSILRSIIRKERNSLVNSQNARPGEVPDDAPQAPETYIALVPAGGIPAATPPTGTGEIEYLDGDKPGSAECEIYKIVNNELNGINQNKEVYNITDQDITQSWVTIVRDKFGNWIAQIGKSSLSRCDGTTYTDFPEATSTPTHVLGLDSEGCLVRVPVTECPSTSTGTGTGTA